MKAFADRYGLLRNRAKGEQARAALERELGATSSEEPVGVDFRGVRAMSVPFAEGFFVPLLGGWLTGYYDEQPIVVWGVDEDVAGTVDAVLRLRNMSVLAVQKDQAALLGGEEALEQTALLAYELGEFSAPELAERLGITVQAANNRLKELVQRGTLARVAGIAPSGGRQYVYRVPEMGSRGPRNRRPKKPAS